MAVGGNRNFVSSDHAASDTLANLGPLRAIAGI